MFNNERYIMKWAAVIFSLQDLEINITQVNTSNWFTNTYNFTLKFVIAVQGFTEKGHKEQYTYTRRLFMYNTHICTLNGWLFFKSRTEI